MCGIVGINLVPSRSVTPVIVDCLTTMQHRGQDATGIATNDKHRTNIHRCSGTVADLIRDSDRMMKLTGSCGIGHVRYPTSGSSSTDEAQPFHTDHPYGLSLAHNGNLTNSRELRDHCWYVINRQVNTGSDSELILSIFASELEKTELTVDGVFRAVTRCMGVLIGGYTVVVLINGFGLVAFRDPCGIRPLCYGTRSNNETIIASESVVIDVAGFSMVRDIAPGESIIVEQAGTIHLKECVRPRGLSPCIFEYVYFARPDSVIDGASVYATRVNMGTRLANRIGMVHPRTQFDVVVPVPSTSTTCAIQCAKTLGVPYEEGLVRNRYTARTFIMPGQDNRDKSVRLKLNPVYSVFKDRSVLLVDDSIVRGTTARHIVDIVRAAGAKSVYFASAAPPIRYPNVYGIDLPTHTELIAHNREEGEIARIINVDWVCYQSLEDLELSVQVESNTLSNFDTSCFDGKYVAGDLPDGYFEQLENERGDPPKPRLVRDGSFCVN